MKLNEVKSFLRIPVIYGIQNTITNKWYIGSCIDMKDRFQRHRYYLRHGIHHSDKLQRSYNKYGEDIFDIHIIKFLQEDSNRFELEEYYINKYDSVNNGYNILSTCKEYSKFKLSDIAKTNLNKYLDTKRKRIICIDRFSGKITNEFNSITEASKYYNTSTSNISRVCLGKLNYIKNTVFVYVENFDETLDYRKKHHYKGIKFSEQHKEKMSINNPRSKKVYKYDLKYNIIAIYHSRSEAERKNNFKKEYLRRRMNIPINNYIYSHENKDIV